MLVRTTPPLRSSEAAADIQGFFKTVEGALNVHMKTAGAPDGVSPVYIQAFPKARLSQPGTPFDVVTYRVLASAMAATSNDRDRIPREPALRERKPHPTKAGYNQCAQAWWEDVTVEFAIWSNSNENADQLTTWFHKFLMRYAHFYGYFKARGIDKFRFVERQGDATDTREGQELYVRRLSYNFRLEYLDTFEERQLTDVTMNVTAGHDTTTRELSAD